MAPRQPGPPASVRTRRKRVRWLSPLWPLLFVAVGFAIGVATTVVLYEVRGDESSASGRLPADTAVPALSRVPSSPSPSSTGAAVPSPTRERPARCSGVTNRLAQVVRDVDAAMDGYPGTWGFALIDVDCQAAASFPPSYVQYPASAGKIVPVVAVLRAVARGDIESEAVTSDIELVLTISSDESADYLAGLVSEEEVADVLALAGVSNLTSFIHDWEGASMAPVDLAAIWAALLRGDLLPPEWQAYVLDLAGQAVIPEGYETFPLDPGIDGFAYGQKAGFWVSDEEPDVLVGAGFLRPLDNRSTGFAMVLMVTTEYGDEGESRRQDVFPILRDFVAGEVGGR